MGLLGNINRLTLGAFRGWPTGGPQPLSVGANYKGYGWKCWIRQCHASTVLALAAKPTGTYPPDSLCPPLIAGEMSARINDIDSGVTAGNLAGGLNAEAALTGSGDITLADLGLIVSAAASLSGSGDITSADMLGVLQAEASLSGSGTISAAAMGALASLLASLTGSGTVSAAGATATGDMAASITVTGTGLTTGNVGAAVWGAIASSNNVAGTMGALLNAIATPTMYSGSAASGASTSVTLSAGASTVDDYYVHGMVLLTAGTGAGQARRITAYDGSTLAVTVAPAWETSPNGSTELMILPFPHVHVGAADAAALLPHLIAAGLIV
jgi:hypothetical protein